MQRCVQNHTFVQTFAHGAIYFDIFKLPQFNSLDILRYHDLMTTSVLPKRCIASVTLFLVISLIGHFLGYFVLFGISYQFI